MLRLLGTGDIAGRIQDVSWLVDNFDGYHFDNIVLPIFGLSLHLLPYFMYTNSEASGQTLQMHWLVWAFADRRCKINIQNHDTGFQSNNNQTFSMKCYLP